MNGVITIKYQDEEKQDVCTKSAQLIGKDKDSSIEKIIATKDEGYIAVGYFKDETIQIGEYTLTNSNKQVDENGNTGHDIMLVKYNKNDELEWATAVGVEENIDISSISQTEDNGYVIVGNNVNEYGTITEESAIIIKYNSEGKKRKE